MVAGFSVCMVADTVALVTKRKAHTGKMPLVHARLIHTRSEKTSMARTRLNIKFRCQFPSSVDLAEKLCQISSARANGQTL